MTGVRLSRHARGELRRRNIPLAVLTQVLENPQQVVRAAGGRKAYQSIVEFEDGRTYLVRAIVDDAGDPATVVTVYRTSRIGKYWRES